MIRVLVWNENYHERHVKEVAEIYPNGIHDTIANFLRSDDVEVKTATQDDEHCGITREILAETDVLIWWGHIRQDDVPDDVAVAVRDSVLSGMGVIFLHSAHCSKPFRLLMGTTCNLCWRESGDSERLWVVEPGHPITAGIDRQFFIPHDETYGEPFGIPTPDKLLLIGSFSGSEVFRSACLFERGNGKVFYFQPGHETFPVYHIPEVQTVIRNAVRYLVPATRYEHTCPMVRNITDPEPYAVR